MDHTTIEKKSYIEKYVLKYLSAAEELLFEEHLLACDECFTEVQKAEKIISGIKQTSFKDKKIKKRTKKVLITQLNKLANYRVFLVAASILIIVLIYPAWQGIFTVSHLQEEIEKLNSPRANIQSYFLQNTRAENDILTIRIAADNKEQQFILNFNIFEKSGRDSKYIAEIIDKNGKQMWETENLKDSGEYEVFSILCRANYFKAGDYSLLVKEIELVNRGCLKTFEFSFKIIQDN